MVFIIIIGFHWVFWVLKWFLSGSRFLTPKGFFFYCLEVEFEFSDLYYFYFDFIEFWILDFYNF